MYSTIIQSELEGFFPGRHPGNIQRSNVKRNFLLGILFLILFFSLYSLGLLTPLPFPLHTHIHDFLQFVFFGLHSPPLHTHTMYQYTFIIAHCKENLEHVSSLVSKFSNTNVYIFHKCGVHSGPQEWNHISLPNVGREGHSFIYFILNILNPSKRLQLGDEFYIFLQAGCYAGIDEVYPHMIKKSETLFSDPSTSFVSLHHGQHNCNQELPWFHDCDRNYTTTIEGVDCLTKDEYLKFVHETFNYHFGGEGTFTYRGQFMVQGKSLQSLVQKYGLLLDQIYGKLNQTNNPCWGFYLERSWGLLFLSSSKNNFLNPAKMFCLANLRRL